jgi:hypothetical protein
VYASAQLSRSESEGVVAVREAVAERVWQHVPFAEGPAQPVEAEAEREAASVLQNRVLFGSERHWAQVPGLLPQVLTWLLGPTVNGRTSPSEGGGVNCECAGALGVSSEVSAAISAQMQGVPSWQKPQRSAMVAGDPWVVGRFDLGFADENSAVKSVSSSSGLCLSS